MKAIAIQCLLFVCLLSYEALGWSPRNLRRILPLKFINTLAISQVIVPLTVSAIPVQYRLPPIDLSDPNRCQLVSSNMGQANAARDKLYDLRQCVLTGQTAEGKDLSGMIASEADFSGVSFRDAQISK